VKTFSGKADSKVCGCPSEAGNVLVEFIVVVVVFLMHLIYFAQSVAIVTSANLAIQNASQLAARAFVVSASDSVARTHARSAATVALSDGRISKKEMRITVKCEASPCLTANKEVSILVSAQVTTTAFGFFPSHVVTVKSTHVETVDEIRQ